MDNTMRGLIMASVLEKRANVGSDIQSTAGDYVKSFRDMGYSAIDGIKRLGSDLRDGFAPIANNKYTPYIATGLGGAILAHILTKRHERKRARKEASFNDQALIKDAQLAKAFKLLGRVAKGAGGKLRAFGRSVKGTAAGGYNKVVDVVKKHPVAATTGGAALLGAGGLYGAHKLLNSDDAKLQYREIGDYISDQAGR